MTKIIKTALASFGMSGQIFHGPLLKYHPGFEVIRVMQRSSNSARLYFPDVEIVRSFDDLLNDMSVELVIVNTPDHLHYEQTKLALEAGKHVVVEKPFVQTTPQGEELINIANKKGLLLAVFQNRRWDNGFLTIKKVISDGMIGRLVEYEARYDRYRNFVPVSWKENADVGAGILQNLGSHLIDQSLQLFGSPVGVVCNLYAMRENSEVMDFMDLQMIYPGKISVTLKASYLAREPGPVFMVHGTEGSYIKYGMDPQEEALKNGGLPNSECWGTEPESLWGLLNSNVSGLNFKGRIESLPGNYISFYDELHTAIRNGGKNPVPPNEALDVVSIIEAAAISAGEKRLVAVP